MHKETLYVKLQSARKTAEVLHNAWVECEEPILEYQLKLSFDAARRERDKLELMWNRLDEDKNFQPLQNIEDFKKWALYQCDSMLEIVLNNVPSHKLAEGTKDAFPSYDGVQWTETFSELYRYWLMTVVNDPNGLTEARNKRNEAILKGENHDHTNS